MKITPTEIIEYYYNGETDETINILECCDSSVAVLSLEQVSNWIHEFKKIATAEDAGDYCAYGSSTLVFDIDGQLLVVVSDSGGELAGGLFMEFCRDLEIPCQFIIDSLECTGVEIEDIYTGEMEDNIELLTLVHKIYN